MAIVRDYKNAYQNAKKNLTIDDSIRLENRNLFLKVLEELEYKLQRVNGLRQLDNGTYKTLRFYITRFICLNQWFSNKPLTLITKEDIKSVYDSLEDGQVKTKFGKPYETDRTFYHHYFSTLLFEKAGKLQELKEIIKFTSGNAKEVRFITEDDFKKIVLHAYKQHHRLLFWLAWDIGENVNALLQLKKRDFFRQVNPQTKESEYRINLKKDILKRSRRARSEITNYNETVHLLDNFLDNLSDDDFLFNFDYRSAKKVIDRAVERSKVKCIPNGEKPTWKDLRSGMSCDLLKKGWSCDEVNARLGHRPSSDEIDKYVNFLAIDMHRPKAKVHQFQMEQIQEELERVKGQSKLEAIRNHQLQAQMDDMQKKMAFLENFEKYMKKQ